MNRLFDPEGGMENAMDNRLVLNDHGSGFVWIIYDQTSVGLGEPRNLIYDLFWDIKSGIFPESENPIGWSAMTLEMAVMDSTGDSKQIWDINNPDEVEVARTTFNALRAKGYTAFHVKADGEAGTRMDTFEPTAGKLIMVPQLKGG